MKILRPVKSFILYSPILKYLNMNSEFIKNETTGLTRNEVYIRFMDLYLGTFSMIDNTSVEKEKLAAIAKMGYKISDIESRAALKKLIQDGYLDSVGGSQQITMKGFMFKNDGGYEGELKRLKIAREIDHSNKEIELRVHKLQPRFINTSIWVGIVTTLVLIAQTILVLLQYKVQQSQINKPNKQLELQNKIETQIQANPQNQPQ